MCEAAQLLSAWTAPVRHCQASSTAAPPVLQQTPVRAVRCEPAHLHHVSNNETGPTSPARRRRRQFGTLAAPRALQHPIWAAMAHDACGAHSQQACARLQSRQKRGFCAETVAADAAAGATEHVTFPPPEIGGIILGPVRKSEEVKCAL